MTTIEQLNKRVDTLAPKARDEINPLAYMSDDKIEQKAREILISHGRPEAATMPREEFLQTVREVLTETPNGTPISEHPGRAGAGVRSKELGEMFSLSQKPPDHAIRVTGRTTPRDL